MAGFTLLRRAGDDVGGCIVPRVRDVCSGEGCRRSRPALHIPGADDVIDARGFYRLL